MPFSIFIPNVSVDNFADENVLTNFANTFNLNKVGHFEGSFF